MTDLQGLGQAAFGYVYHSTLHLQYEIRTNLTDKTLDELVLPYLEAVGQYNNFEPERVLDMLKNFDAEAPKSYLNDDNPNNGKRVFDVWVSRESSPAIYVKWRDWRSTNYDAREMAEAVKYIENQARHYAEADEFSYETETHDSGFGEMTTHEIRMWWD